MIKNENIICISSIDWDFVWQGHQEIMSALARHGNRVLFIENTGVRVPGIKDISRIKSRVKNWSKGIKGIRKEADNLYIFSPLVLPFPYSRPATFINRCLILPVLERWMKTADFENPIIWTFLPTRLTLSLLNGINSKFSVYYCIADFEKLVKDPSKVRKTEKRVVQKVDLVFAQGEELKKHCERYNPNVAVFPFGVNLGRFLSPDAKTKPADMTGIKKPVLGYIGGIHRHIDFKLVDFIARRNPDWTLLFIGPSQTDISPLKGLSNIVFLDMKAHKELANYVYNFDVCLIPYLLNEYTATVYPTKLNEYLAMGKPVVSTPIPEMISFRERHKDAAYIGKDNEEFERCINAALKENSPQLKDARIRIAKENSWENRIEDMSGLIERGIQKKKAAMEALWKENLLVFYKKARIRIFKTVLLCGLAYLLFFKTSFFWLLAEPLKISDAPRKADAIAVFGGGVGETGSPGKSTIERARYAAELYKEGYADKIIFSSGYSYVYNDAENMRLIAVSSGIADKDIVLELKANSTYENVIFTKKMLKERGWKTILLVSSPYNMRRASLVFKKDKNGLRVFYTPVQICQFYQRPEGLIRLEQIKAILHEYLGIVYYWFKGYI